MREEIRRKVIAIPVLLLACSASWAQEYKFNTSPPATWYVTPAGGLQNAAGNNLCNTGGYFCTFTFDATGALRISGSISGSGDGAIQDGVTPSIEASVLDYTSSNPLAVRLTDTNGDYVGAGGGSQYTDGAAQATPIGTVAMGHDGSNVRALTTDAAGDLQVDVVTMPTVTVTDGAGAMNVIVDSGAVTVSGTVTANAGTGTMAVSAASLPLPTGASTAALQDGIVKDGTGDTTQANVTSGRLNVDGSGVTQPVSGTVTANAGTNLNTSTLLTTTAHDAAFGTAGVADAQVRTVQGIAGGTAVPVSGTFWQTTQPVSGTVTANAGSGTLAVSGPLTDTQLRATAVPVSGTFWQATQPVSGTVDAAQSGTWTVQPGNTPNTSPWLFSIHDGTNKAAVLNLAANDPLSVAIVDGSGSQITSFGGGTQYTEDAAAAADPVGTAPILVRADTPGAVTTTNGDNVAQRGTNYGAAFVQVVTSSGSLVDSFGGAGGTAQNDNTAVAQVTGMGALYDTTPPSITDGNVGLPRMTSGRVLMVDGSATTQPVSGTVTANAGTGTMAVSGTFWQATQPVSGTVTVTDGAGALNTIVDSGTLIATQATGTNLHTVVDSGSVTVSDGAGALNVIVDSGSTVVTQGTGTNLHTVVDSGAVTVSATNLDVQIGGSDSLTIGTFPDNEPINVAQVGGAAVVAGPCEREVPLYLQVSQTTGTQLVAGTASERIYICSVAIVTATAQNIALVDGTGTVCATSPTGLLGGSTAATGQNFAANGGWVLPFNPGAWAKTSTDADNLCLLQSSTGQISGIVTYVSVPNI